MLQKNTEDPKEKKKLMLWVDPDLRVDNARICGEKSGTRYSAHYCGFITFKG